MATTLKEFLISIDWDFSAEKQRRFVDAMKGAEVQAKLLADALEALARKAWDSIADVAEAFDRLYFSAQRTGATASTIKDFGYAVKQLGGSAEAAQASLEAMGQKLRENPANIAYLERLGLGLNKINGHLEIQADKLAQFQQMPMAIAEQYRALAGMDERTFLALRDPKLLEYMREAANARKLMGFDPDQAAKDANGFMTTWRRVALDLGIIADDLFTKLMKAFDGPFQEFQKFIEANGDEIRKDIDIITSALGRMAEGWVKSFEKILKDPEAMDHFQQSMRRLSEDVKTLADSFSVFIGDLRWLLDKATAVSNVLNSITGLPQTNNPFATGPGGTIGGGAPGEIGVQQLPNGAPAAGGATPPSSGLGGAVSKGWNWLKGKFGYGDSSAAGAAPATLPSSPDGAGGGAAGAPVGHLAGAPRGLAASTQAAMSVAMDQLRREGVPEGNLRAAAALLTGNAIAESALVPTTIHDGGTGYGIYGARLERRDHMLAWLAKNGYANDSLEGQMRYMAHEAMSMPGVSSILAGATDGNLAANDYGFIKGFENPAIVGSRAQQVRLAYNTGPGAALSAPADGDGANEIGRFVRTPSGGRRWVRWGVDPGLGGGETHMPSTAHIPTQKEFDAIVPQGDAQIRAWEQQKANPWETLQNYWGNTPPLGVSSGDTTHNNSASVNQTNTYNIQGAGDPHAAAAMVAAHHDRQVEDITRNMIGAVY